MANSVQANRFRWLWVLCGLVVLAIAAGPWVAPYIKTPQKCHPEALPTVKQVALDVCVDGAIWSRFVTPQAAVQGYGVGREKVYLDTISFPDASPPEELRESIITAAHQYATNDEDLEIVGEHDLTLGGRPWRSIELASQTSQFIYYYYSAEGFGTIELFFLSFKDNVERRKALAAPILASVKFTGDG